VASAAGLVLLATGAVMAWLAFRKLQHPPAPPAPPKVGVNIPGVDPKAWTDFLKAAGELIKSAAGVAVVILVLGVILMSTGALAAGDGRSEPSPSATASAKP